MSPIFKQEIILEIVLQDTAVFYYTFFAWFRKSENKIKENFTYHKTTESKLIFIVLIIFILIDIIVLHFLISIWNETVAWIITILNIYVIFFIVASFNSMRYYPHVLKDDYLIIQKGFLESVLIKLDNIATINKAKERMFLDKNPKDEHNFTMMIDSAHYEITLKSPVQMKGYMGRKK